MSRTETSVKNKNLWFGDERYAQIPVSILLDTRLAPRHLQILLVLSLHANRTTGVCYLSREAIADYTSLALGAISTATSDLRKMGWLEKGQKGSNMPNRYKLMVPTFSEGQSRTIQNRRIPDEIYAERHAEVLAEQEAFRVQRREQHMEEFVAKHERSIEGLQSEFVSGKEKPLAESASDKLAKNSPSADFSRYEWFNELE